jgi:low affinity Fe/Cu permease
MDIGQGIDVAIALDPLLYPTHRTPVGSYDHGAIRILSVALPIQIAGATPPIRPEHCSASGEIGASRGTGFHLSVFRKHGQIDGRKMLPGLTKPASGDEAATTPLFARFARWVERQVGRSSTFVLAIAVVLLWAVSGPVFGWSDTWQLVINTGTTIVTFLMVFVIQNTQSRDTQAMQLKLDELIRVNETARNSLINLEEMSDIDVERMKVAFAAIASNRNINEPIREPAAERVPAACSPE